MDLSGVGKVYCEIESPQEQLLNEVTLPISVQRSWGLVSSYLLWLLVHYRHCFNFWIFDFYLVMLAQIFFLVSKLESIYFNVETALAFRKFIFANLHLGMLSLIFVGVSYRFIDATGVSSAEGAKTLLSLVRLQEVIFGTGIFILCTWSRFLTPMLTLLLCILLLSVKFLFY